VVEHLTKLKAQNGNMSLAYVYCTYRERRDHTATKLIANIVQQLIQDDVTIPENLISLYRHHVVKQTSPTLSDWSKLLQFEIRRRSKIFILVDALDERREEDGTTDEFLHSLKELTPDVYLFVTSRPSSAIEREFENVIHLELRAHGSDIGAYVDDCIAKAPRLRDLLATEPMLREGIADTVTSKSKGM